MTNGINYNGYSCGGSFMPHQGLIMNRNDIKNVIYQIANVYPILPIEFPVFEKIEFMSVAEKLPRYFQSTSLDDNGCMLGPVPNIGKAISEERIGRSLERFNEFYCAESEDHLDPAIEHFDGIPGMSFHDVVNQVNVY